MNILSISTLSLRSLILVLAILVLAPTPVLSGDDDKPSAEAELARIAAALPKGFKQAELRPLLEKGQKPDEDDKKFGFARVRVARMTSDTTAKITISFYFGGKEGEEEYTTLFLYLSWYKGWWTVTKTDGSGYYADGGSHGSDTVRLIAYIDEVSGTKPKPVPKP